MKQARSTLPGYIAGMLLFAILTCSCNNSGKKTTTSDSTVVTDSVNIEKVSAEPTDNLRTLRTVRMTKQNFMDVFQTASSDNNIKMIYFELDIVSSGIYGLRAFGADRDGNRETGDFDLQTVADAPVLQFDPGEHGYTQQLTRGNVKAFLGVATGTDTYIRAQDFKNEVWLSPCTMKDENGETLIYFRVTEPPQGAEIVCPEERTVNERGSISTNPSPPAKPCEDNCEEPIFRKKYNKADLKMVDSSRIK